MAEGSAAVELTTSSMQMEITAIKEALRYMQLSQQRKAVIVTDSMSTLEKVKKDYMHTDSMNTVSNSRL